MLTRISQWKCFSVTKWETQDAGNKVRTETGHPFLHSEFLGLFFLTSAEYIKFFGSELIHKLEEGSHKRWNPNHLMLYKCDVVYLEGKCGVSEPLSVNENMEIEKPTKANVGSLKRSTKLTKL